MMHAGFPRRGRPAPPEAASAVLGVLQVKIELGPTRPLVPLLPPWRRGPERGLAGWGEKKSVTAKDQRRLVAAGVVGCKLFSSVATRFPLSRASPPGRQRDERLGRGVRRLSYREAIFVPWIVMCMGAGPW